ncbi:radical SAM domain protein [Segatella oris F0302]|uniref:Radical SAM domain protein n=1 Tax=Segatella oris F0302 TaxID=649760 RepID=D1QR93_9BACT|nr:radical SAM peptide maturase [Segatella oris]EFB32217.1 radical SAM domain protein [Segatella oris F0302]
MKSYLTESIVKQQLLRLDKIIFEVTDACNLQCKYCGYGKIYNNVDERLNKKMTLDKAIRLLTYFFELWQTNDTSISRNIFISFYGGEPLLNMPFIKNIISFIENTHPQGLVFHYSMTTNAVLLDKYVDYLYNKNIRLLISLDGNKRNNSYRLDKMGNSVFDKIVKNATYLKHKYPKYFNNKVNFNAVLHDRNSVYEINEFIYKQFGKKPSISELNTVGVSPEQKEIFHNMYKSYQSSSIESIHKMSNQEFDTESPLFKEVAEYIFGYSSFVYQDYFELRFGKSKSRIPTGTCLPFSKNLYVTVNGKLLPCEHIGQENPLGYVSDDSVDIEPDFIANFYNRQFEKIENQCVDCKLSSRCTQCIFNFDDFSSSPRCQNHTSDKLFKQYSTFVDSYLRKYPEAYQKIMKDIIYF